MAKLTTEQLIVQMQARLDRDWAGMEKFYPMIDQINESGPLDDAEMSAAVSQAVFNLVVGELRTRMLRRGVVELAKGGG